jgi:hypothetical protein
MTPEGVIYSREAILEYYLKQKKMLRKKLAAWEAQQQEATTKVGLSLTEHCCTAGH